MESIKDKISKDFKNKIITKKKLKDWLSKNNYDTYNLDVMKNDFDQDYGFKLCIYGKNNEWLQSFYVNAIEIH